MINDLALLAGRLFLGQAMAAHGSQKALGWFDGPGPEKAAGFMESLGFRPGQSFATLQSWNEIVSGELIGLGLGGPLGPAMLIAGMVVAARTVHGEKGFFAADGGFELPSIYAAAALALAGSGYGSLSLDAALGLQTKLRHPVVTTLALAGAIAGAFAALNARNLLPAEPATPTYQGANSPLADEQMARTAP